MNISMFYNYSDFVVRNFKIIGFRDDPFKYLVGLIYHMTHKNIFVSFFGCCVEKI